MLLNRCFLERYLLIFYITQLMFILFLGISGVIIIVQRNNDVELETVKTLYEFIFYRICLVFPLTFVFILLKVQENIEEVFTSSD